MRARLLLAAAASLVLVGADLASSSWSAFGTGSSGARAEVLQPPGSLTAVRRPTGIELTWSGSPSAFIGGYRVLRSASSSGPYVELAAEGRGVTGHLDSSARAGTWHYVVVSTSGSWRAATSVVQSAEPVYYVRATNRYSDTRCPGSAVTVDLQQGHVAPAGPGTSASLTTVTLCTDTYSAGQSMPAGVTTVNVYVVNSHKQAETCTVDLVLLHNGAGVAAGTGVVAPGGTSLQALSWQLMTPAVTFATGDRLGMRLTARANSKPAGNNCSSTTIYGDGSQAPSNVTFPR